MGVAGTGKTFLSLAAGLEQGRYRRVSVYRPLVAVGRQEVGYLPGDLNEKLTPWMAAVHDNLYARFSDVGVGGARGAIEELIDRGELEMAAVTYLRERWITGEFVIIDEAQNLELSTLKVILTRMSRDSKVVFCGDLSRRQSIHLTIRRHRRPHREEQRLTAIRSRDPGAVGTIAVGRDGSDHLVALEEEWAWRTMEATRREKAGS